MDLDAMLAEAAPSRRANLDGAESPAAARLYRQITITPLAPATAPRRRRVIALPVAGVAAGLAAAAAAALILIPGSPLTAAHGQQGARHATLAAWTATRQPDGLVKVTISELRDPQGLARTLRADGVPVNVQFVSQQFTPSTGDELMPSSCRSPQMSDKATALLQAKITPYVPPGRLVAGSGYTHVYKNDNPGVVWYIQQSAIPQGIGLYIAAWVAAPGTRNGPTLDGQLGLVLTSAQCTGS
jgi:hypothetical protein